MAENYKLLMHGWGNTPAQKRKEAEYNKKYYQEHKEKWKTLYNKASASYEKADKNTGSTSIYNEERKAKKLQMYKDPYKGLYDGDPYKEYEKAHNTMTSESKAVSDLQKELYDGLKKVKKLSDGQPTFRELDNKIAELESQKVSVEDFLSPEDMAHPAIVAQVEPTIRKKNKQIDDEIAAVRKQLDDLNAVHRKINEQKQHNAELQKELDSHKTSYEKAKKDYDLAKEATNKGMSVGRLRYEKEFDKKLRNKKMSDQMSANEASKAEATRKERLARLTEAEQRKNQMDKVKKQAKRAAAYQTMKEYEAELAAEKNAPLHKKARKFVDGTVEVAMDNAKNALSKLKKPAETAQAKQDKKKKISQGKAWVFKNLGIELF